MMRARIKDKVLSHQKEWAQKDYLFQTTDEYVLLVGVTSPTGASMRTLNMSPSSHEIISGWG